jgi:acyl-CoA synthetase (AMP-forming)/AMP-acid ligase II
VTDEEHFALLFWRNYPRVLAIASRRTEESRAHDVVAETFATAWRHFGRLPEDPLRVTVSRGTPSQLQRRHHWSGSTTRVEQALMQHPDVQDCAVIGLPDEKWGERVTAVVQLRPTTSVTPQSLIAFARKRLGGVKTPKQVEIWSELPRSRVGKVLKRDIKQALAGPPR